MRDRGIWLAVDLDLRTARGLLARGRGAGLKAADRMEEPLAGGPETWPAAIASLAAKLAPHGARTVLVLPRRCFLERILAVPKVASKHVPALLRQELDANLPWTGGQRLDAFAPLPAAEPERPANRQRFLAVSAQTSLLAPLLAACRAAGAEPVGVVPAGIGLVGALPQGFAGAFLLGTRDEADLVFLGQGGWEFSRAFPWSIASEELGRSAEYRSSEGSTRPSVHVPDGVTLPDPAGLAVQRWRPDDSRDLPPPYWAAWGALRAAAGRGALPLVLRPKRQVDTARAGWRRDPRNARAAAVIVLGLVGILCVGGYRWQQYRQATALTGRAAARREAEVRLWRRVPFPIAQRLATMESLALALPDGTRLISLRLEGERLAELSLVAPRATEVLSALEKGDAVSAPALAGPVTRREPNGAEAFTLTGRVRSWSPSPAPAGAPHSRLPAVEERLAALQQLALAGVSADRVPNRLLYAVEEAAAVAGVRLVSKNAVRVPAPPERERFSLDVSLSAAGRELVVFLGGLARRAPLLSLDNLTAQRTAQGRGLFVRLQFSLDRPSGASTLRAPGPGGADAPPRLAQRGGVPLPPAGGYPALAQGEAFGETAAAAVAAPTPAPSAKLVSRLTPTPPEAPAAATPASVAPPEPPPPQPPPQPPPPPPRSAYSVAGLVYDQANPHALLRPMSGGAVVIVKPGDLVGGEEVLEVGPAGVVVRVKGTVLELPLPGPPKQ